MNSHQLPATDRSATEVVASLVERARAAQREADSYDQEQVDNLVLAVGWAILEPSRNQELAELAVADTGMGSVEDKVRKNHRKTFGLLRDLHGVKSVGVIAERPEIGITEIARPAGVVAAITPSTNPAATPANNIINALKGRNAIIVAPSPKAWTTCARLVEFIHAQFDRIRAPLDLVQMLPAPVTKVATYALMSQADLVVATGSQANVRAAYSCGTPAFGVGAGNVASIVDESADPDAAAEKIVCSKTFDHATSCSSENSVVIVEPLYHPMLDALQRRSAVLLDATMKSRLQSVMWLDGSLSALMIGQSAVRIAELAGLHEVAQQRPRVLLVEEDGFGRDHPFSGEKLSPVLAVYRASDFEHARLIVARIYQYMGAGHSVGLHTRLIDRARRLGETLPVSRVIVNQAHAIATGGSFDNGLPFSLSMGCGTWGRNNFSNNLNWRHFVNITRIVMPIAERVPSEEEIFGSFFQRFGRS
jgi:sulfoacetaldehyde dehydrogenase